MWIYHAVDPNVEAGHRFDRQVRVRARVRVRVRVRVRIRVRVRG